MVFRQEVNDPTRIERYREVVKDLTPPASEAVRAVQVHGLRVEGEMVKVGSMRRAKRILLIAGVLLLSVSTADARHLGVAQGGQAGRRRAGRRARSR